VQKSCGLQTYAGQRSGKRGVCTPLVMEQNRLDRFQTFVLFPCQLMHAGVDGNVRNLGHAPEGHLIQS
jgi:hypothetical protein